MSLTEITTDRAPKCASPLSQAVRFGDLLFVSGQVGASPESRDPVPGGIREQTKRVMDNLKAVLEAGRSSLGNVLKTTCFLTDMADFAVFNEIYARYFPDGRTARSAFEVSRLAGTYVVEVEAIAAIPQSSR
ncbi:MAG: hypothetical protein JF888_01155 [Candidatus Dormibacteraeota bacterium]|uniref:RidA family protein n=1 Tax=Candidatus Dormiibacter inghamiae TaxID=3127013 RepID=A0A934KF62_9BACT|nr:hypothetical protein [Candidatus Dormibacteraeota bacterium]MBJ7605270.1 hypothetical protein [Candidatus Dormibacteraeota bacterium]